MRRRVWSETLPYDALVDPTTLRLLARFDVELIAAVRPWDLRDVPRLVGACNDAGVGVGLWPMIGDADGRWANALNALAFTRFARDLLDAIPGGARVVDLAVDLEPPFGVVTTALRSPAAVWPSITSLNGAGWKAARGLYRGLIAAVHERGLQCSSAAMPFVLLDPSRGPFRPVQRALTAPVDALPWDHVSVMIYSSMVEGWSAGLADRGRSLSLLARGAAATRRRFGEAAGVSLGVVDVGALGDEPRYRDPAELSADVAAARAAGVDALSLFDLGGVLRRAPADAWFEAFVGG